jgi:hypothetical protein
MNSQILGNWIGTAVATGSWVAPVASLLAAFVFGQTLAWVYERTYVGLSYSRGFSHTLVLVCISASVLVLSMSHSLVAGIGLFGVLSMIRFRTDLKTSRDLVFVMGAASLGVTAGVAAWMVGILGVLTFSAVALYLALGPFGSRKRFDGVLRFNLPADEASQSAVQQLLDVFCRRSVLLSTVDIDSGRLSERLYQVKFFDAGASDELLRGLREDAHAEETRLMLQDSTSEY